MTINRRTDTQKGAAIAAPEPDGNEATARPANELDRITFQDPLMRLVQQILGPFVTHRHDCEGEPCTCGLTPALDELQHREILVKRYGTADG